MALSRRSWAPLAKFQGLGRFIEDRESFFGSFDGCTQKDPCEYGRVRLLLGSGKPRRHPKRASRAGLRSGQSPKPTPNAIQKIPRVGSKTRQLLTPSRSQNIQLLFQNPNQYPEFIFLRGTRAPRPPKVPRQLP